MAQIRTRYDLAELKDVIQVLDSLYKSKGIDLDQFFKKAVQIGMKCLSGFGGRSAFNTLREAKCNESSLAILLYLIRSGPNWSNTWRLVVGSQRRRKQTIAILERAATTLETLDKAFEKAIARDRSPWRRDMGNKPKAESEASDVNTTTAPAATARSLRAYIRVLDILGNASTQAKIHSPEAFGKYVLSGYVKETTGDYHDAEVSALISSALGEPYTEGAHCMWRSRNWKNLEAVSFPFEFLITLVVVLAINT